MKLTTNLPGGPELRFAIHRGLAGAPMLQLTCDVAKWNEQWATDPAIRVVRSSDVSVMLACDGGAIHMRGQATAEHNWLAGWEGMAVEVKLVGNVLYFQAKGLGGVENEAKNMMTAVSGGAMQYDQMEVPDLVTEAVRRGLSVRSRGMSAFTGDGKTLIQKHVLVKTLREYDQAKATEGLNLKFEPEPEPEPVIEPAPPAPTLAPVVTKPKGKAAMKTETKTNEA